MRKILKMNNDQQQKTVPLIIFLCSKVLICIKIHNEEYVSQSLPTPGQLHDTRIKLLIYSLLTPGKLNDTRIKWLIYSLLTPGQLNDTRIHAATNIFTFYTRPAPWHQDQVANIFTSYTRPAPWHQGQAANIFASYTRPAPWQGQAANIFNYII